MRRERRRGFALVTALWALVVVGALGVPFHTLARADRQIAANLRAATQARWAARAGFARTMEALDRALASNALRPSGDTLLPPLLAGEEGVQVQGVVLDARARLHVNLADGTELQALFEALGIGAPDAERLADAVLDWRDADEFPRARGAEAAEYLVLRPASRPRNAPLDRVEELRAVRGMSGDIYERVAPYVTVVGDGRVNVNSASTPVLLSLPGMDPEGAAAIARRRRQAPYRNVFDLLASLPRATQARMRARLAVVVDRVAFTPREVEVVVEATPRGGSLGAELSAVVVLRGGATRSIVQVVERQVVERQVVERQVGASPAR